MKSEFDKAQALVLRYEGGYVNHPRDPGGPTNRGITQRTYDAWREKRGEGSGDVRGITDHEVYAIYRANYWDAVRGDDLPPGIDLVVYDFAVNSGPARAIRTLQAALGVAADGKIGDQTVAALKVIDDHDAIVADICARRLAFMRSLKTWGTFGKGWAARVANVQQNGFARARGKIGASVAWDYREDATRKARDTEAKPRPTTTTADAGVVTGGMIAGAGSNDNAITQAKDALEPIVGTSEWAAKAFAALTIIGVALALGSLAWRWWQSRKAKAYDAAMINTQEGVE